MKHVLLAIAMFPVLTACPAPVAPPKSPSTVPASGIQPLADGVVIRGTQSLIIANLVYQTVGTAVAVGMEQGVISGPLKSRLQALDLVVREALRAGRGAKDAVEQGRQSAKALGALAEMARLARIRSPQF